ncbi:MAG: ATP-binding cassette domain-containing protein, partial [Candidatus Kariarchaeaceae archaeon]
MEEEKIKNTESNILMKTTGLYNIYKGKEGASNVVALRGINLEVKEGEFIAIVGPSGSGKSTLMRCVGGLQQPSAGSVV